MRPIRLVWGVEAKGNAVLLHVFPSGSAHRLFSSCCCCCCRRVGLRWPRLYSSQVGTNVVPLPNMDDLCLFLHSSGPACALLATHVEARDERPG